MKQYPAARAELRAALALDPNDRFAHYYAGMAELAASHAAEALDHFARCCDLVAKDVPTSFEAALAGLHVNRTKDALDLIAPVKRRFGIEPDMAKGIGLRPISAGNSIRIATGSFW